MRGKGFGDSRQCPRPAPSPASAPGRSPSASPSPSAAAAHRLGEEEQLLLVVLVQQLMLRRCLHLLSGRPGAAQESPAPLQGAKPIEPVLPARGQARGLDSLL